MTILVMPSLRCNLKCLYCFERPVWESSASELEANVDAIIGVVRRVVREYGGGGSVCLHGGEPLTLPIETLEYFFSAISRMGCRPSIQTNGVLITDEHIKLFRKYSVHIGVSVDGPPDIPTLRGEKKEYVAKVNENLLELRQAGVSVGVLCVLSRANATGESLDKLCRWVEWLHNLRISGRFLTMRDFFGVSSEFELSPEEMTEAWLKLYDVMDRLGEDCNWSPFRDVMLSLQGRRRDAVCWMNECDPFATRSCHVILPDGSETICDRAFHNGLLLRPDDCMDIRQKILAESDCKGCRWFGDYCVGGCPLDGVDNDWRNKSKWCMAIKALFEKMSYKYPPAKPAMETQIRVEASGMVRHGDTPHGDWSNHGDSWGGGRA
ncbi:MAG: radical SAM protein [Candidatus Bathyarchaeia archaeon]